MRLLRTLLALTPCGKPQAAHFAHLVGLLQWLPGRLNFTGLEHYGGRSARTHARWFARPFPFARLAVAALGAVHPRVLEGLGALLALDASFVSKSGGGTWGTGWFRAGMARAVRWGLEVTLLAVVDTEEGGAYPLCARQSPGTVRSRLPTYGAAGAGEVLSARWAGCARTRSCASPTPVPTNAVRAAAGSSTAASTAATRRAWPASPWTTRRWTCTMRSCTARSGSAGCRWSTALRC